MKLLAPLALLLFASAAFAADRPSIFIAGDSTAADGNPNAVGWGRAFPQYFDLSKIDVVNDARGGRSSRTFITEGLWDKLLDGLKKNDIVIIQFGHNDASAVNDDSRARGSLPGLGDETEEIDNQLTHKHEIVHTYGWYMRKMVRDTKEKGAMPILASLTTRDVWKDGHVERGFGKYGEWTRQLAEAEAVAFIDLTALIADRYDQMGETRVKALFPADPVHTNAEGADLNARSMIACIRALRENAIIRTFSPAASAVTIARPEFILMPHLKRPVSATDRQDFMHWLNLPDPANPALPTLFLIGDSTVRNGRGDGIDGLGQWGWGDPLAAWFNPAQINVVNRAVGGTGAMSFLRPGYWDRIVSMLKPGDFVIMQFGHNDNGAAAPLKGVGEETEERNGQIIHTWGWYIRKYISEARAKGATPIVCTLIPRNQWENGKVLRPVGSHADWAREVARAENAPLLDLYERIAKRYDPMGQDAVTKLFADQRVHTTAAGAELNASIVIEALKALPDNPLKGYVLARPADVW